jgi:hypothetical protein
MVGGKLVEQPGRHRGFPAYDPSDCSHDDAGMNMTEFSMESIDDAYAAVQPKPLQCQSGPRSEYCPGIGK